MVIEDKRTCDNKCVMNKTNHEVEKKLTYINVIINAF